MIPTCYRTVLREVTLSLHPEAEVFLSSMANVTPLLLTIDPSFSSELSLSKFVQSILTDTDTVDNVEMLHAECLAIPGIRDLDTFRYYCDRVEGFEKLFHSPPNTRPRHTNNNPMKDLHRLLDRQNFASIEEAQEFMKGLTGKPIPEIPLEDLTSDQIAEDLVESSMDYPEDKRIDMLKSIAADFPTSMAPWLRLAELATSPDAMLEAVERGLSVGARFSEERYVAENTGHYWGLTETRPYMKLLNSKAMSLYFLRRLDDAIEICELILRLNPDDNMGIRGVMTILLLERGMP